MPSTNPKTRFHRSRFRSIEHLEDRCLLAALTPGNFLVSTGPYNAPVVRELDPSGTLVQEFSLPADSIGANPRGLAVDDDGNVFVYHGTFDPKLDQLDVITGSVTQWAIPGWSTVANISYGGIATLQEFVFLTDMNTGGGPEKGIIRVDTSTSTYQRFGDTIDFMDLTLGLDGILYGLTAYDDVYAFDPLTLDSLGNVRLSFDDHRDISVDRNGDIFTATWNGFLTRHDSQGALVASIDTDVNNLNDVDLHDDGTLVASSRFGDIVVADKSLTNIASVFSAGTTNAFVTFTDGPLNHHPSVEDQTFSIAEDSTNGTLVGQVIANDIDGNGITYQITDGNSLGVFSIDSQSGDIIVSDETELNYETQTQFLLTVNVTDDGNGSLTDSATVTIDIEDVNDVSPTIFANSFSLEEGETLLLSNANLAAADADSDDSTLLFVISGLSGGQFNVGGAPVASFTQTQLTSNQVRFLHDDGELAPAFNIVVTDGVLSSGILPASIDFTNVNDNPPDVPTGQAFEVSEDAANGTFVGTVVFSDADLPGDTFSLSIIGGDADGVFAIDENGNVTVNDNATLDFASISSYALTVEVSDGASLTAVSVAIDVLGVAPQTKFYVVDTSSDKTFEYASSGSIVEDYGLSSGNTSPRGATANLAGTNVWVVDADDYVYVYDSSGNLLGAWDAKNVRSPEGIATNGTDIWIVDRRYDRVYRYDGGASFLSGDRYANFSFKLNSSNRDPWGLTTDGTYLWVLNDSGTNEMVFKYTVSGTLLGSWSLDPSSTRPEGITIDPSNVNNIWVVDRDRDQVFQYDGAVAWTSGTATADAVFDLAAGNSNPRGIADPPPPKSSEQIRAHEIGMIAAGTSAPGGTPVVADKHRSVAGLDTTADVTHLRNRTVLDLVATQTKSVESLRDFDVIFAEYSDLSLETDEQFKGVRCH